MSEHDVPDCTCGVDPKHDCFAPPWAHHPECPYRTFKPVTAREDQPQLGTCEHPHYYLREYRQFARDHEQSEHCVNWKPATEDQPRPTCVQDSAPFTKHEQVGVDRVAHPSQDALAQIDKDETIIAIMESHANWVARAETAEAEVERLKVELERRDPTREAAVALLVERAEKAEKELADRGSTPSPDPPQKKDEL